MDDMNLQEQYAILEKEREEDKRKTIIIIILCILIILITLLGLYFAYSNVGKTCTLNCDTNGDGIPDTVAYKTDCIVIISKILHWFNPNALYVQ